MKKRITFISIALLFTTLLFSSPIKEMGEVTSASTLLSNGKSKYVSVFAINDFHGSVEEDIAGKNLGSAKLAQVINDLRGANPESIFLSAGDNYQGSALSNMSKGKVVSDFFKEINLAASTIGNHEFDWGDELFPTWQEDGGFSFLAANIIDKRTKKIPTWAKEYELFRVGGHLIAVIGSATQDTVFTASKKMIENYEFTDPAKAIRKTLRKLQAQYPIEAVVVLSHVGAIENRMTGSSPISASNSTELEDICKIKGVDAVITGHSHEYVNGKTYNKPVVQAFNYGRAVSVLQFKFSENKLESVTSSIVEAYKYKDTIIEDSNVSEIVASYKSEFGSELGETVAYVEAELSHEETIPNVTPLGYVITTAMKNAFKADMAITNGGGLRKSIRAGTLTVNDMWELIPFDNTGVTLTVKGSDLKKIIDHGINSTGFRAGQFAGGKVYYTTKETVGKRVKKIILDDGREVKDDGEYKIVVNDFMFEGGDRYDMLSKVAITYDNTYVPFRDAVIAELKKMKTINKTYSEIPRVLFVE